MIFNDNSTLNLWGVRGAVEETRIEILIFLLLVPSPYELYYYACNYSSSSNGLFVNCLSAVDASAAECKEFWIRS
jgi:hypothetical protein